MIVETKDVEDCKRLRCTIQGENAYILVGRNFVTIKLPHENRPENKQLRDIVETLAATITEGLEMMAQPTTQNNQER